MTNHIYVILTDDIVHTTMYGTSSFVVSAMFKNSTRSAVSQRRVRAIGSRSKTFPWSTGSFSDYHQNL